MFITFFLLVQFCNTFAANQEDVHVPLDLGKNINNKVDRTSSSISKSPDLKMKTNPKNDEDRNLKMTTGIKIKHGSILPFYAFGQLTLDTLQPQDSHQMSDM